MFTRLFHTLKNNNEGKTKMIRNYSTIATGTRNGWEWKLITDNKDGSMSLCLEYANGEVLADEYIDIHETDLERLRDLFALAITNKTEAVK